MLKKEEKKTFQKPVIIKEQKYETVNSEHCHQVKTNDCSFPMKA